MNLHPSHSAKVFLVILSLALSSLIFGISAADYYSYPKVANPARKIYQTSENSSYNTYKIRAKTLFDNLNQIVKNDHPESGDLNQLKTDLMSLMVPREFMNLHVGLVLAADKLLDYSKSKDNKKLEQASSIITQAQKQYDWLN